MVAQLLDECLCIRMSHCEGDGATGAGERGDCRKEIWKFVRKNRSVSKLDLPWPPPPCFVAPRIIMIDEMQFTTQLGIERRKGGRVRTSPNLPPAVECNMAQVGQSKPDSGLGFQVKDPKTVQDVPSSLVTLLANMRFMPIRTAWIIFLVHDILFVCTFLRTLLHACLFLLQDCCRLVAITDRGEESGILAAVYSTTTPIRLSMFPPFAQIYR